MIGSRSVTDGVSITGRLLGKLQSLQNAAARLVTGARKFDRITPVMRELHWLPVRQRIRFKTAVLVFKCLRGLAPEYLSEYCKLTTGRSHLRSANACLLSVPRTQTTYGDRSFAVSGPVVYLLTFGSFSLVVFQQQQRPFNGL